VQTLLCCFALIGFVIYRFGCNSAFVVATTARGIVNLPASLASAFSAAHTLLARAVAAMMAHLQSACGALQAGAVVTRVRAARILAGGIAALARVIAGLARFGAVSLAASARAVGTGVRALDSCVCALFRVARSTLDRVMWLWKPARAAGAAVAAAAAATAIYITAHAVNVVLTIECALLRSIASTVTFAILAMTSIVRGLVEVATTVTALLRAATVMGCAALGDTVRSLANVLHTLMAPLWRSTVKLGLVARKCLMLMTAAVWSALQAVVVVAMSLADAVTDRVFSVVVSAAVAFSRWTAAGCAVLSRAAAHAVAHALLVVTGGVRRALTVWRLGAAAAVAARGALMSVHHTRALCSALATTAAAVGSAAMSARRRSIAVFRIFAGACRRAGAAATAVMTSAGVVVAAVARRSLQVVWAWVWGRCESFGATCMLAVSVLVPLRDMMMRVSSTMARGLLDVLLLHATVLINASCFLCNSIVAGATIAGASLLWFGGWVSAALQVGSISIWSAAIALPAVLRAARECCWQRVCTAWLHAKLGLRAMHTSVRGPEIWELGKFSGPTFGKFCI
jgi:hypothetical protein